MANNSPLEAAPAQADNGEDADLSGARVGGAEHLPGNTINTIADAYGRMQRTVLPDLAAVRGTAVLSPTLRPRNRTVVSDLAPRDHVLPAPNGWFALLRSIELAPGDVVTLKATDQDLVVYRDDAGSVHAVDPYCPHMGAHLGGGLVLGENLQCPYHGWEYGPSGACVNIPYSDARIPARAQVATHHVCEQDGFVYLWKHAGGGEPTFDVPRVPEHDDPAWASPHVYEKELVAALQEMAENNVDFAHFKYVHGREVVPKETSVHQFDGAVSFVTEELGDGLSFRRESYGPGIAILRFTDLMTIVANSTPIDRGNVRLIWHFYFPHEVEPAAADLIESVVGQFGIEADVPIWRDMKFQEHPVLVKGDGPIPEYRRWYGQFYEGN
jgi:phenylpropionate dioxygenase-like ring-hydroxylating dioxygenase large terminal subunit